MVETFFLHNPSPPITQVGEANSPETAIFSTGHQQQEEAYPHRPQHPRAHPGELCQLALL